MSNAKPGITRRLPQPTARVPWRNRAAESGLGGTTVAAQLGPWNYTAKIYVAWDPPTAANPTWIDVTQFVDVEANSIVITRGRPDGESDPQVGTCTLTVDNSDGRWSEKNPNGAWFGQIRKGCWLRVDNLPPSGIVSTRFVGFIQQLPVQWTGRYSQVQISASDQFVLLQNAKPYGTAIFQEWMSDPSAGQYIAGYWPLDEPQGATYVSDTSGNAAPGQDALSVRSYGVNSGVGLAFANTSAPGYDGASTVNFTPSGTLLASAYGGNSGSFTQGSYLAGNVGPMGNVAQVTMWINTSQQGNQPIFSWSDPAQNYAMGLDLYTGGQLNLWQGPISGAGSAIFNYSSTGNLAPGSYPLNDGTWHEISIKFQTPASRVQGSAFVIAYIDGVEVGGGQQATSAATGFCPQATCTRMLIGAAEGWNGDATINNLAFFTGAISDVVVHIFPNATLNPDLYGSYQAAAGMWQSSNAAYAVPESCGRRVIRLGSYAGVPAPLVEFLQPNTNLPAFDVTPAVSAFFNIPAETAHPAGTQQLSGTQPLTAMQTAAHTENMPLFVDRQGRITLQPSTLRQNPSPAFTINAADLEAGTQWANDFQYLQNQTVVTPSGQGSLTVNTNGQASQNLNGLYSNGVDSITTNALESASLGAAINFEGADPQPRHNPLACEVATLATQTGIITPNANFVGVFAPWQAFGGTGALSSTVTYQGAPTSGLLTPDGVSSQAFIQSGASAAVVPLQNYNATGLVYSPTGYGNVAVSINWYNASGYMSTSSGSAIAVPAGAWTTLAATGLQAPAGATYGEAVVLEGGTPPATALLYVYNAGVIDPTCAYGPGFYDAILAADISTVVQVVGWPSQSDSASSGTYYIEGYTETISAGTHLFEWNTSPTQGPTYQLDSPTLGLLDTPGLTLAY